MNDKWMISVLVYFFVLFVFVVYDGVSEQTGEIITISFVSAIGISTSLIFVTMKHYKTKSERFSKSYLYLGIGFIGYVLAELLYGIFDSAGILPFPSPVDIFYGIYFVGSILFCLTIFWCRKNVIPHRVIITSIASSCAVFVLYVILSINYSNSFETFWACTVMMGLSSVLLGSAVLATITTLKAPKLRRVWVIFGIALVFNSIADILYYAGENTGEYAYTDISTLIWFGSILMVFFAVYKHRYLYLKN